MNNKSVSQDVLFSQFYASPLSINPANTGDHNRYWKFMNNYRSEWKSTINPFISTSLGYDQQVYLFEKRFSAGVFYIYDRSGTYLLSKNKFYLSAAYHHEEPNFIYNAGLQFGIASEKFDSKSLTFPDQYDISLGEFNPNLPTSEEALYKSIFYPDLNIGISIRRRIGRFVPNAGISIYHINKPSVSYQDADDNPLNNKKIFHFGGQFYITKKLHLQPDMLLMNQNKSNTLIIGTKIGIDVPRNLYELKNFYVGSYLLIGEGSGTDALIFSTGLVFYNFLVGISYDYNITGLNTQTYNRGAIEISIVYLGQTTDLMKVTIPCDRY